MTTQTQTQTQEVKTERRGRPIVNNSHRQMVLAQREAKRQLGVEIKRGRPTLENSDRQARLALWEEKRQAGIEIKRGRPSSSDSHRQMILSQREEKRQAGIEIKRGRPKMEVNVSNEGKVEVITPKSNIEVIDIIDTPIEYVNDDFEDVVESIYEEIEETL